MEISKLETNEESDRMQVVCQELENQIGDLKEKLRRSYEEVNALQNQAKQLHSSSQQWEQQNKSWLDQIEELKARHFFEMKKAVQTLTTEKIELQNQIDKLEEELKVQRDVVSCRENTLSEYHRALFHLVQENHIKTPSSPVSMESIASPDRCILQNNLEDQNEILFTLSDEE